MKKILIDNGHGIDTKGKCSPDGKLREWAWTREVAQMLVEELTRRGYDAQRIVTENTDIPLNRGADSRVKRVNTICKAYGATNCLLVSIHINAAPDNPKVIVRKDTHGAWKTCRGFCVMVAPNASTASKRLAATIYTEAEKHKLQGNRAVPKDKYWIQSLAMCRDTNCPAVLTENLFQDNESDAAWLQTAEGKRTIVALHADGIEKYIKTQKS